MYLLGGRGSDHNLIPTLDFFNMGANFDLGDAEGRSYFNAIPDDCMLVIFSKISILDENDLAARLSFTCKRFLQVGRNTITLFHIKYRKIEDDMLCTKFVGDAICLGSSLALITGTGHAFPVVFCIISIDNT